VLATLNVLPFVYALSYTNRWISGCVEWQSVWESRKKRDLFGFEREQIVSARLTGIFVTNTATLGVSRATVSKVKSAYTNHGKTASAKRNRGENQHWQKEIIVHWEWLFRKNTGLLQHRRQDCRIEYSSWRQFPQKLSYVSFTNPTSAVGLQMLNLRLLKVKSSEE
jgi:hypothetical protein